VIVKPIRRIVRRQQRGRINLEREHVADGIAILDAVETMQGGPARVGVLEGEPVEGGLEPRRGAPGERGVGPRTSNRRHRARPNLAHDLFPHVGVLADPRQVQHVERESAGLHPLVVAGDAVLVEHGARWRVGRLRRSTSCVSVVCERNDHTQDRDDQREPTSAFARSALRQDRSSHRLTSSGIAAAHGGGHFISLAPSFLSSTAVCGWAANEFPYSTPSATINGVRPSFATTSSFAPLSKRYCTTLFAPRYAAACIAVSPRSLTWLTSAPSSSTSSLTASSTWLSEARSWFEAQAMPAAAISGVMFSSVPSAGSAPWASSKRITSTSADLAARRNAVAPARCRRYLAPDHLGSSMLIRPLTSAPCASSDLMTRTLSIFTAMNWSLMCQLATCTAACSGFPKILPLETPSESRSLFVSFLYLSSIGLARTPCTVSSVDPPSTFGSAPLSSRKSTRSSCPLITATSNGVAPSGLAALTSAPADTNARTAAISPRRAANKRGVAPLLERAPVSAR